MKTFAVATLAVLLAACSSEPASPPAVPEPANVAPPAPSAPEPGAPASTSPELEAPANVLTLEGLGPLRLGQPVPAAGGWAERGAQTSDNCRTVSNPAVPGVYAIVTDGAVRRITVGQRSDVKLVEGIGVGAAEADVRGAFPGFREEPHKYVDAPGKYLTAPNAAGGDPALRFEVGADGKVSLMHVGTMPVLGYVEGCA